MTTNQNPAPRANAGSRADFKAQRNHNTTSARKGKAGGAGPDRVRKPQDGFRANGPTSPRSTGRRWRPSLPCCGASCRTARPSVPSMSRSTPAARIGVMGVSRSTAGPAAGPTSRPATRAAIQSRLSPTCSACRKPRRRARSPVCLGSKPGGGHDGRPLRASAGPRTRRGGARA
jgi:hypothetical protein